MGLATDEFTWGFPRQREKLLLLLPDPSNSCDRIAGRPKTEINAHVVGRSHVTIGICLIGGHGSSERDRFADHFTTAQEQKLRTLIAEITSRTAIEFVTGNNQYAAKALSGLPCALLVDKLRKGLIPESIF